MPDINKKNELNVPGKYFVDKELCIDCDQCSRDMPNHFKRNEAGGSYVWKQPVTPAEIAECEEALARCPAEAIGNNG